MAPRTCEICGATESHPMRLGAAYEVKSAEGRVLKFWMCNPCAIPLSPMQGPIALEDPRLKV